MFSTVGYTYSVASIIHSGSVSFEISPLQPVTIATWHTQLDKKTTNIIPIPPTINSCSFICSWVEDTKQHCSTCFPRNKFSVFTISIFLLEEEIIPSYSIIRCKSSFQYDSQQMAFFFAIKRNTFLEREKRKTGIMQLTWSLANWAVRDTILLYGSIILALILMKNKIRFKKWW